jgi:hypothetical protein
MRELHYPRVNESRWSKFVLILVICSLMLSVSTRFCVTTGSHFHTVKTVEGQSPEPKRQHLDSDAVHWVAPITVALFLEQVAVYPRLFTADTLPPSHVLDESLYNRPPPQSLL